MQTTTQMTIFGTPARLGRRAVDYGRMSDDDGTGQVKVDDQLSQCRDECVTRDLDLITELSDNGISAHKDAPTLDASIRPGFRELVRLIRGGLVDWVVCYQMSRVVRNRDQRAELITLCGKMKVNIVSAKGQDFNLASATGRGFAGMLGEQDSMESELKSERTLDACVRRAKDGRPNTTLGYGWTTTGIGRTSTFEVNEEQAEVIREMTRRVIAGDSLTNIKRDLNARGVPAPKRGSGWIVTSIRTMVLRPSNAALRVHHRGKEDEQTYPGCWPALVSQDEWQRATVVLRDPARTTNRGWKPRRGARKHMLTYGIGRCGTCGGPLRVRINGRAGLLSYFCMAPSGCTSRSQRQVDDWVNFIIGKRLMEPDALVWARPSEDGRAAVQATVDALNAQLLTYMDRLDDGRWTIDQVDRQTARVKPRLEQAESELAQYPTSADLEGLEDIVGEAAMEQWAALSLERKVRFLHGLGIEVTLLPTRKGPGFNPNDVQITSRGRPVVVAA